MSGPGDAGREARLIAAEDALHAVLAHDADSISWGAEESIRETLQWIEKTRGPARSASTWRRGAR